MNTNLFDATFPFTGLFRKQADTLEEAVKRLADVLQSFTAVPEKCARISELVSGGDAHRPGD